MIANWGRSCWPKSYLVKRVKRHMRKLQTTANKQFARKNKRFIFPAIFLHLPFFERTFWKSWKWLGMTKQLVSMNEDELYNVTHEPEWSWIWTRHHKYLTWFFLMLLWFTPKKSQVLHRSGWWFQIFFIFNPTWGNNPIWLIFFKWVETTN